MEKNEQKEWIQKNKSKWIALGVGLTLLVLGIVLTVATRAGALAENAGDGSKIPFALGLIMILMGIVIPVASARPEKKKLVGGLLLSAALVSATARSIFPWVWKRPLFIWAMCSACWLRCSWAVSGAVWPVRWV